MEGIVYIQRHLASECCNRYPNASEQLPTLSLSDPSPSPVHHTLTLRLIPYYAAMPALSANSRHSTSVRSILCTNPYPDIPTRDASDSNIPRAPPPPRPRPQPHSHPTRNRHRPKRTPIAPSPIAHLLLLAHDLRPLHAGLVHPGINSAPDRGPGRRHHGHDPPVRAEVLHAPYDGDDDWGEGEDGAVAEADEGGDEGEEWWVRLDGRGGEDELAEGEEEGAGEEKRHS